MKGIEVTGQVSQQKNPARFYQDWEAIGPVARMIKVM